MNMRRDLVSIVAATMGLTGLAFGAEYYVSPKGNDSNDGKTLQTAWQTLEKVSKASSSFRQGDFVYLESNQIFEGTLSLIGSSGSKTGPITFISSGKEKAKIVSTVPNRAGIHLKSTAFISFSNLEVSSEYRGILLDSMGAGARDHFI